MSNSAQAMTATNVELRRFFAAPGALYNQVCANWRVLCQANSVGLPLNHSSNSGPHFFHRIVGVFKPGGGIKT